MATDSVSRRLYVVDDVLRAPGVGIPYLDENLRWLEGIARAVAGPTWTVQAVGGREGGLFSATEALKALGQPATPDGWAAARSATVAEAESAGLASLLDADFVFGFGLPPVLLDMLLTYGTPFISLEIDAVRFADDLLVTVTTDDTALQTALAPAIIPDAACLPALAAFLAKERRRAPTEGLYPGARVGLFAGQAGIDASLIQDLRIAQPCDFKERVAEIAATLDILLVRPHPMWPSIAHLRPILDAAPNAVLTLQSSYSLLADPCVTDVIALSSSLLMEAAMAGKRTHRLLRTTERERSLARKPQLQDVRVSWDVLLSALTYRFRGEECPSVTKPIPLHASIRSKWGSAVEQIPPLPVLTPSQELHAGVSAFAQALIYGWHGLEQWGAWAAQPEAILVLRLPPQKTATLRLAFCACPRVVQTVEIATRNGTLATARVAASTTLVDVPVSQDMTSAGYLQLFIRSANMASPASLGVSQDNRPLGIGLRSFMLLSDITPSRQPDAQMPGAACHASLRDANPAQQNNWLVEEAELLSYIPGNTVLELGCGNGRYLDLAAKTRQRVVGCDWALAPGMRALLAAKSNVEFIECDISQAVPQIDADIVLSADVLEHLPLQCVAPALAQLTTAGRWQFHKIACYDDGQSHLTIRDPAWWLAQFCNASPSYRLVRSEYRLGDPARPICIISNFPFAERNLVVDPLNPSLTQAELAAWRTIARLRRVAGPLRGVANRLRSVKFRH